MVAPTRVGEIVAGKYRVERELGRGGMGVVVAARHLGLRERVAIKFLLPRPGSQREMWARFVREGRAAMRIRSEHVVKVHDIGTLETGEPYLVMEYLKGTDLAGVLAREGARTIDEAVECILQACEALAEAHARGIVHRDLKPGNLFLSHRADGSMLVKVLDFGIAKNTSPEESETGSFGTAGTPVYMAPEQMRSGATIDVRTDVWALGVTLHTLITGEAPFRAGSVVEVHERIQDGAPLLRTLLPDAPAALEAILQRTMQKDPSKRYASVAALAEALADIAPEHARVSARRAARIEAVGPIPSEDTDAESSAPTDSDPDGPQSSTKSGPPSGSASGDRTDMAASASWLDANVDGEPRARGDAQRTRPRGAQRNLRRLLPLVLAALGGGAVAFLARTAAFGPPPAMVARAAAAPTDTTLLAPARDALLAPVPSVSAATDTPSALPNRAVAAVTSQESSATSPRAMPSTHPTVALPLSSNGIARAVATSSPSTSAEAPARRRDPTAEPD